MGIKETVGAVKAEVVRVFEEFEAGIERVLRIDVGVLDAPAEVSTVEASGTVAEASAVVVDASDVAVEATADASATESTEVAA